MISLSWHHMSLLARCIIEVIRNGQAPSINQCGLSFGIASLGNGVLIHWSSKAVYLPCLPLTDQTLSANILQIISYYILNHNISPSHPIPQQISTTYRAYLNSAVIEADDFCLEYQLLQ